MFPLTPGGKTPLYSNPHPRGSTERGSCRGWAVCRRFGHGVLDATVDVDMVTWWWARTPSANIGLATGVTPAGASVDVVDIDVKDGAPGLVSFERLRRAGLLAGSVAVVDTPSGGMHLYYEPTGQPNGTIRRHGVDFRGAGGYVVVPPCPVGKVRYTWREPIRLDIGTRMDWLALRDYLVPPPLRPFEPARGLLSTSYGGLVEWVAGQAEGNRNASLHWAVCQALESGAPRSVVDDLASAAGRSGLDTAEVRKTVESATRRAVTKLGLR